MDIIFSKKAQKQLRKLPKNVLEKLFTWVTIIEKDGIDRMRKIKGFRDEALKGKRIGQRSSRLNIAYRVIYTEDEIILEILEVNKHEY